MKRDKYKVPLITLGLLAVFAVGVHKTHWKDAERERQANHTAALITQIQEAKPSTSIPNEYLPALQARPKYDFREINWGMKVNEVKLIEHRLELLKEGKGFKDDYFLIYQNIPLFGEQWSLSYFFEHGQVFLASYTYKDASPIMYEHVVDSFSGVYGPPTRQQEGISSWVYGNSKVEIKFVEYAEPFIALSFTAITHVID